MFEIYTTEIFDEWHANLKNPIALKQISARLIRLAGGNFGDFKIFDGLIELRFHNRGGTRIYCIQDGSNIIVLLAGGDKSSQENDIELAKNLMQEYWSKKDETS